MHDKNAYYTLHSTNEELKREENKRKDWNSHKVEMVLFKIDTAWSEVMMSLLTLSSLVDQFAIGKLSH